MNQTGAASEKDLRLSDFSTLQRASSPVCRFPLRFSSRIRTMREKRQQNFCCVFFLETRLFHGQIGSRIPGSGAPCACRN